MIDIISKFFSLCFEIGEGFDNLDNILRHWAYIRYKKVLSRH